jgi:hypothetical protein
MTARWQLAVRTGKCCILQRMKTACPLCSARPAKRSCPALGRNICPVCCATKRQVEISCPPDCGYLSSARAHPAAVVQRQHERDMHFLIPLVADLSETQYRLFLFAQALVIQHTRDTVPSPIDVDVADAVASVAATLETAGKGIIYEHRPVSIPAQRLATELASALADVAKRAGSDAARVERDTARALRALERTARDAAKAYADASRPETAWLALAARVMASA